MHCASVPDRSAPADQECQTPSGTVAISLMHRIRNPLSVIMTAASQLPEWGNPPEHDDPPLARTILMAAEQIEDILRRYTQYACPEPPQYEPLDLDELCRIEIDRARNHPMAEKKKIKFSFIGGDHTGKITCDLFLIRIALAECIDNAIEAVEKGGAVSVRTEKNDFGVMIVIDDTGHGVPDALIPKIWQPFYTTRPGKPGLGLPIASRIMAAHHGRINLEPRPGGGARVTLTLPDLNLHQEQQKHAFHPCNR